MYPTLSLLSETLQFSDVFDELFLMEALQSCVKAALEKRV